MKPSTLYMPVIFFHRAREITEYTVLSHIGVQFFALSLMQISIYCIYMYISLVNFQFVQIIQNLPSHFPL